MATTTTFTGIGCAFGGAEKAGTALNTASAMTKKSRRDMLYPSAPPHQRFKQLRSRLEGDRHNYDVDALVAASKFIIRLIAGQQRHQTGGEDDTNRNTTRR